jgi:pimeloyl-ACP methyl ester carboxylesterase
MTSRFAKTLIGLSIVLSLAALVLGGYALMTRISSNRELDAVRGEIAQVQQGVSDQISGGVEALAARIEGLEGRVDDLSSALDEQISAAAAQPMNDLSREIDQLRAFLEDEYPDVDLDNYIPGEVVEEGRFVIMQSGAPIGSESYRLYESGRTHTLVSSLEERRLGRSSTLEQQYSMDAGFRPVSYKVSGNTPSGFVDVSLQVNGDVVAISDAQSNSRILLPSGSSAAILDSEPVSQLVVLHRAFASFGEDGNEWTCIAPLDGSSLPIEFEPSTPATLVSGSTNLEATRYTCIVGDGREIDYSVLDDEVVAIEIPGEALFAYRSDRFPDGLLVKPWSMEDLALPYDVLQVDLPLTNGGVQLSGTLTYPTFGGDTVPIFLMLPDFGRFDRDGNMPGLQTELLKQMAISLAQQGIATYRFDYPGVGASGGDLFSATIDDLLSDARIALMLLRALSFADPEKIYVLGHGEGGVLGMLLAAETHVGGLVTIDTPAHPFDAIRIDEVRRRAEAEGLSEGETAALVAQESDFLRFALGREEGTWADVPFEEVQTALPWMTQAEFDRRASSLPLSLLKGFCGTDPTEAIRSVGVPVRVIQGEKDFQVPAEEADLLIQALEEAGNPNGTLSRFENLNHWLRNQDEPASALNQHLAEEIDGWAMVDVVNWLGPALELPPGGSGSPAPRS